MTLESLPFASCSLPQAAKALGVGSAAWLVQIYQWVTESDTSGGLPQATWGRGIRDTEIIYLGLGHKIRDFKFHDTLACAK